jgi:hypothetical protein
LALGIMTVVLWIMCATGLHAIGWLHDGTRWTVFGGAGTRFGSDSDWGIMLVPNWPYHDLYLDWEGPGFEARKITLDRYPGSAKDHAGKHRQPSSHCQMLTCAA